MSKVNELIKQRALLQHALDALYPAKDILITETWGRTEGAFTLICNTIGIAIDNINQKIGEFSE